MIHHENRLPADDYLEISCLICYFSNNSKIWNCRLLQIIGGALRVDGIWQQWSRSENIQITHIRDQARGRLGQNSCHRGRNFTLNGTQGEVGVSLKKKKKKTRAVETIYYHCIVFLLQLNGNSMYNGWFASKWTKNAFILSNYFSLSDCHFSLIFLQGEVTSPYCQVPAWTLHIDLKQIRVHNVCYTDQDQSS